MAKFVRRAISRERLQQIARELVFDPRAHASATGGLTTYRTRRFSLSRCELLPAMREPNEPNSEKDGHDSIGVPNRRRFDMSLTGVWRSDDGGQYHIHDLGSEIIFFGQRTDEYGTVFRGARAGNLINGWYVDVPYGRRQSAGVLQLSTNNDDSVILVGESMTFTSRELRLRERSPTVASGARFPTRPARYQSRSGAQLTGSWTSQDGANYYVTEVGGIVTFVAWFAQHPDGAFASAFFGTRSGRVIQGRSADVPGLGRRLQSESFDDLRVDPDTFQTGITDGATMRRSSQSGLGDWVYTRFESAHVLIDFRTVTVVDPNEGSGDEPYLWPFVIKLDGDTVSMLSAPRVPNNFRPTVLSSNGSQRNLTARENLPAGTVISVPREIGHFETTVRTALGVLPRTAASDALTQLIILGIVWEEDGFVERAVDAAYRQAAASIAARGQPLVERAVNQAIFQILTGREPEFDLDALITELVRQVKDDAESAGFSAGGIGGLVSLIFGSPDDFLGRGTLRLPFSTLTANSATASVTIPFTFNLLFPPPGGVILGTSPISDDRSNYTLQGTIIVEPSGQLI